MMALMPLARSPWDAKGSRALQQYSKNLEKRLKAMVPWRKASGRRESLRGKVKSGETVVVLGGSEIADDPLYKDAVITRE